MRVVLLTHGGADLVIEGLASLNNIEVAGVFIETVTTPLRGPVEKLRRSIRYDGISGTARKFLRKRPNDSGENAVADRTREVAAKHGIAVAEVENFHSEDTIALIKATDADLGVIFGTNIIKESVFSIPKLGSINLHQGLAPYYRGGPPVFWELCNDEKEVGLTVHFVAAKVDTGDIVLQKKFPLEYDPAFGLDFETFIEKYRSDLREESARLVAEAVAGIVADNFERTPQDTRLGKRYRLPTKKEKDELRRRLKARLARGPQ
jgi:methionyl-tRNA formyltransferase